MKQKKEISEQLAYSLVQFYAVVLFECNESEDYGPAMTLMNTAFTFHHEGKSGAILLMFSDAVFFHLYQVIQKLLTSTIIFVHKS